MITNHTPNGGIAAGSDKPMDPSFFGGLVLFVLILVPCLGIGAMLPVLPGSVAYPENDQE
jgi:hypothetical protein